MHNILVQLFSLSVPHFASIQSIIPGPSVKGDRVIHADFISPAPFNITEVSTSINKRCG